MFSPVAAAAANGIAGCPTSGIGTDNGSACCNNVGDDAAFSKSCKQRSHAEKENDV